MVHTVCMEFSMRTFSLLFWVSLLGISAPHVAAQTWHFSDPLGTPRTGAAVTALDGVIYVMGGQDGQGNILETVVRFDPALGFWERVPSMNQPRAFAAAVTYNGQIYVIGGRNALGQVLNDVEYYDPASQSWYAFLQMDQERQGLAAAVWNDVLFVAGGSDQNDELLASITFYDNQRQLWVDLDGGNNLVDEVGIGGTKSGAFQQLGTPRASFGAVVVANQMVYVGGFGRLGPLSLVQLVEPGGTVTDLPPLPTARGGLAAAAWAREVYAIGGRDAEDQILADVDRFDLDLGMWQSMPRLNEAREGSAAVVVDGILYVVGGQDARGRVLDTVEILSIGGATVSAEEMPASPRLALESNFPNPFRTTTTLTFSVPPTAPGEAVTLTIYDLQGREVARLLDAPLAPGRHQVTWDGTADGGTRVSSGVYVCRLRQGDRRVHHFLTMVR